MALHGLLPGAAGQAVRQCPLIPSFPPAGEKKPRRSARRPTPPAWPSTTPGGPQNPAPPAAPAVPETRSQTPRAARPCGNPGTRDTSTPSAARASGIPYSLSARTKRGRPARSAGAGSASGTRMRHALRPATSRTWRSTPTHSAAPAGTMISTAPESPQPATTAPSPRPLRPGRLPLPAPSPSPCRTFPRLPQTPLKRPLTPL